MNAYKQHFLRLAIYNRWAYHQLFDKLKENTSDEKYFEDSGLFFRSIHGTLVHLLLSSKLWYARLTKSSSNPLNYDQYPFEINSYWSRDPTDWEKSVTDRIDLVQQILEECDRWIVYVNQLNCEQLENEQSISYLDTQGNKCERKHSEALDHIFNHNTHHRGQITAVMTKYGGHENSPVLDLSAMPVEEYSKTN